MRMRALEFAADFEQMLEARNALVVAQAAWIVIENMLQGRYLSGRLEHFVNLLLVLDDRISQWRHC